MTSAGDFGKSDVAARGGGNGPIARAPRRPSLRASEVWVRDGTFPRKGPTADRRARSISVIHAAGAWAPVRPAGGGVALQMDRVRDPAATRMGVVTGGREGEACQESYVDISE